jgi:uncharacterized membrane protein
MMRWLQLLAIVVWVGGIVFFAFVLAPVSFHTLPSVELAGSVVGASLKVFDLIALGCGFVFLVATGWIYVQSPMRLKGRYELELLLAGIMLVATAYLQWGILPPMDRDRVQAGGDISAAAHDNPARIHFDRFHARSEHVEELVLVVGLGVIFLLSRGGIRDE